MKNIQDGFYPVALTVNSSDSSGAGGIQSDLRTFNAAGIYGCSAVTAVTVRNFSGQCCMENVSGALVGKQLDSILNSMAVKAVKIGRLGNLEVMEAVVKSLQKKQLPTVIDPVMFSGNGTALLDENCMQFVKEKLLPSASFITLDIFEAAWLLDRKLQGKTEIVKAAQTLADNYKCNIFLAAGCDGENALADGIVVLNGKSYLLSTPALNELDDSAFYGSRDTFSGAVTAMLACGNNWKDAVRNARAYVYGSLCETALVGKALEAMYPPLEDYSRAVSMSLTDKNSGKSASAGKVRG